MPFNPAENVIYGEDALTPEKWARETFCTWLTGKLNDPTGPYAAALGVTPTRRAFVSENMPLAGAMFKKPSAPPVVTCTQGPITDRDYRRQIGGVIYEGRRIEMECLLDMGVGDATPTDDNLADERRDDNNLVGFVTDAVREGYNELNTLGLFDVSIKPDAETPGRNPQRLTFFLRTLRDWNPTP